MTTDTLMTNDNTDLVPRTTFDGPTLEFDLPGLRVGVAEYDEGPTGCTVFHFPEGATTAVDVRGGAVGKSEVDYGFHHAICFAGGSLYGLEAISGVRAELFAQQEYLIGWDAIPLVGGAIIWDWKGRENSVYPDKALGRAAMRSAVEGSFPLGRRGAGRRASCGKWLLPPHQGESAGQGGAFWQAGPIKVAVFSVVNALGGIIDREGNAVRGHLNPETGERHSATGYANLDVLAGIMGEPPKGNTTLTLVVTNVKVERLDQLAKHVHGSMARAIYPFHTNSDGDILFAATTGEVAESDLPEELLAHIASEVAWDAVLSCWDRASPVG